MFGAHEEGAAEDVTVTRQVLGEAVDDQVGPVLECLEEHRRRKGRIDDARGSRAMRRGGNDCGNVDKANQRVGDHLGDHSGDIRAERSTDELAMITAAIGGNVDGGELQTKIAERSRQQ